MLYFSNKTEIILSEKFSLSYLPKQNFLLLFHYIHSPYCLGTSQDWDRLKAVTCPCIKMKAILPQWKNRKPNSASSIFPFCSLSRSYHYFKLTVSTFLNELKPSFISLLAFQFKTFLITFPALDFHSTRQYETVSTKLSFHELVCFTAFRLIIMGLCTFVRLWDAPYFKYRYCNTTIF